jgi:thiamine pyrophosphokinase
VVLCNGPPPEPDLLAYWLRGADLFVCTDAAGHPYADLPCLPDVVIGDFDSLTGRLLSGRDGPRFLLVREQNTTDSEKALLYIIEEGFTEAVLLGAVGWRLDHTLFNCSLLERYADRLRLCLSGYRSETVRVDPRRPAVWNLPSGTPFSINAVASVAEGVTLTGAQYPLEKAPVRFGGPAYISNRVISPPLQISVEAGSLLVSVQRWGWPPPVQNEG